MSYDDFYEENWELIKRYVTALTQDEITAEDITQNAFMDLLKGWDKIKCPVAYVYEAARSHIALNYRKNREIPYAPDDKIFDQPVIDEYDRWQPLYDAINLLTPTQQDVVKLYFFEQLTQQEIADQLGVKQQSVQETIERAKDKLRELMAEERDI